MTDEEFIIFANTRTNWLKYNIKVTKYFGVSILYYYIVPYYDCNDEVKCVRISGDLDPNPSCYEEIEENVFQLKPHYKNILSLVQL